MLYFHLSSVLDTPFLSLLLLLPYVQCFEMIEYYLLNNLSLQVKTEIWQLPASFPHFWNGLQRKKGKKAKVFYISYVFPALFSALLSEAL